MKKNINEKLKKQKGAATLLTFITVMSFVTILSGVLLSILILRKSQLKSNIKIQEIYESDVKRVNEIYDELIEKNSNKVNLNVSHEVINNKLQYTFLFNKNIKNFESSDIKLYIGEDVENDFTNNEVIISTSNPATTSSINDEGTYMIRFDYNCVSSTQEFEVGFYYEGNNNLPTKNLIATEDSKHEDWIVDIDTIEQIDFKFSAAIQSSNNVSISNIEIIKINIIPEEDKDFNKEDDDEYTLECNYDENSRYILIVEDRVCEDFNGNFNSKQMSVI